MDANVPMMTSIGKYAKIILFDNIIDAHNICPKL